MKIRGFQTRGLPIENLAEYYRDDYDMLQDILSGKWTDVVVIGLRRFGKTSFLKRIEGFVNQLPEYREFIQKGLAEWQRERDGNPPRREFFDEIKELNGRALYLSMHDSVGVLQRRTRRFLSEIIGGGDCTEAVFDNSKELIPSLIVVLLDEFLVLAEENDDSRQKRDFFLKLHRSAQNLKKDVVFVIAEPPSVFSVFDESIKRDSTIAEVTDALQNRVKFFINGLSLHEKYNLFCLRKTKNYGEHFEPSKIRNVLERLSGIPLEIQIAGEAFFSSPEKKADEILEDVAKAFGGYLKNSIIPTMNLRQQVLIRYIIECEMNGSPFHWDSVKKTSHKLFYKLKDFGLIKIDEKKVVRFTSEPVRSILCEEVESLNTIVDDDAYQKELKNIIFSEELGISPLPLQWDGRINIHHFSDLALGDLTEGFKHNDHVNLELFSLNQRINPFEAYLKLLKTHKKYRPHILVFSGDIALNHHSYCYRGLKNYIAEIMEYVEPLPGERNVIPGKQVIIVPGEMDISNSSDIDCIKSDELERLDACSFLSFFHAFEGYGIPAENASKNGLDRKIAIELPATHGIASYNIEILPFNSATMIWPEGKTRKRMIFLDGLRKAVEENENSLVQSRLDHLLGNEIGFLNMARFNGDPNNVENVDDTLRIAVTHHNFNPQKARGHYYTVDTLNAHEAKISLLKNRFSIVLHGHQRTPIFIKETLHQKTTTDSSRSNGLKTLFMNSAGNFSATKYDMDDGTFGPSFNRYVIQRIENNSDGEKGRTSGDFRVQSTVFFYDKGENKFVRDQSVVKEEISIDEE
jgi:hypothetical protein